MSGAANVTKVVERVVTNGSRKIGLIIAKQITFIAASKKEYTFGGTGLFKFGGQATLYFCTSKDNPSEKLIAKIYDNVPAAKFNNEYLDYRKTVSEYIIQNSDFENKHLLPILDHGLLKYEMSSGVNPTYFVEIIPYCENSDLDNKKLSYDELKNKLIPQINAALKCLHDNNYVHRDVKPNNIFLYKDNYVLGDFGAICQVNENEFYQTNNIWLSPGYAPPEALLGSAIASTDYYGFGMTIGTLYNGKYIFNISDDNYSATSFQEVQKALNDKHLPITITNNREKGIEGLILGLLDNNYVSRCKYDDVQCWCKNGFVPETKQTSNSVSIFKGQHGICHNFEELSKYLNYYWDEAIQHIVTGNTFVNYVSNIDQGLSLTINTIISDCKDKKISTDAAVSQALYLISPDALRYKKYEFETLFRLVDFLKDNTKNSSDYVKEMLKNHLISWWINKLKESEKNSDSSQIYNSLLQKIENIENIADKYDTLAYGLFVNSIETSSGGKQSELVSKFYGGNNIDAVFKHFEQYLDYFRNTTDNYINLEMMLAYLNQYISNVNITLDSDTYKFDNMISFRAAFEQIEDYTKIYTILMCLFEKICTDKKYVREFYVYNGPFACCMWVKNNLNKYKEPKGNKLKPIKEINIDTNKSLTEIYSQLCLLQKYVYGIKYEMQKKMLHFKNTSESVTSSEENGMFIQNPYNKHITLGFWQSKKS